MTAFLNFTAGAAKREPFTSFLEEVREPRSPFAQTFKKIRQDFSEKIPAFQTLHGAAQTPFPIGVSVRFLQKFHL